MSRVVPSQLKYISIKSDSRYKPVTKGPLGGIVCLLDSTPELEKKLIPLSVPKVEGTATSVDEKEPGPPEPFDYTE